MGKKSRQKGERLKLGKPARLADMIQSSATEDWSPPDAFRYADDEHRAGYADTVFQAIAAIREIPVVEVSDITEYVFQSDTEFNITNWDKLILLPPFDWMFVESRAATGFCWPESFPQRFGFIIQRDSAEWGASHWSEMIGRTGADFSSAEHYLSLVPLFLMPAGGRKALVFPGMSMGIFLRSDGVPVDQSIISTDRWHHGGDGQSAERWRRVVTVASASILHALMFMNCKNVTLDAHDPDREVNRHRQRAGLKPFLRYHTLNIEPMKTVLRTEGNVDSVGLKKALHICRGHFATYTEEKKLFGRHAGTFWVPAHTRGSLKHGIVSKDYAVKAPTP